MPCAAPTTTPPCAPTTPPASTADRWSVDPAPRSPHAYGNSIDINPWENPFASGYGWTPNSTWQRRTSPAAITYRGANDPVVAVLRRHGFRWLGFADLHHFQR
ncbi:MAG: M15 family metallopeptidase [Aeromicrobium erythreum]